MRPHAEDGVLVLADISGFTEFVTATELEHGPAMIAALLERVMERLAPPLEIQEVEGDAVFALGPDRTLDAPARVLDVFDEAFAAFKARQREFQADGSCECNACRRVGDLDLKIVVHHGRFLRHVVGGRRQVAGADVILAHQLLKNRLGKRAYLLLTEAAREWMGLDAGRAELVPHVERYEHLGDVRCFVMDVAPAPTTAAA
jgi:hypothetical protein